MGRGKLPNVVGSRSRRCGALRFSDDVDRPVVLDVGIREIPPTAALSRYPASDPRRTRDADSLMRAARASCITSEVFRAWGGRPMSLSQ